MENQEVTGKDTLPTVSRKLVWWFRIALSVATFFSLLFIVCSIGFVVNDGNHRMYSHYMMFIATANTLIALYLVFRKVIIGAFLSILSFVPVILSTKDLGFGRPFYEFSKHELPPQLAFSIIVMIMLLSQIPYLKRLSKIQRKGFQREHFVDGASFSDNDLSSLSKAWSAFSMSFLAFYIPCVAFGILVGQLISKVIGGFIGNVLALVLILGGLILGFVFTRRRKRSYEACRDKLKLTENDVRQALRHKKQGTVADVNTASGVM